MEEKKLTPEVRFESFTDDWEQRKLGDVGKCQSGIGFPDVEQGGKIGTPFYKVSDMNNYGNEHEMICANNYVTDEQLIRKNWKPITEVPAVIFAKVGAAIMLNRKRLCRFPFLLDNNTMAYKFGEQWNTNFGKTLFEKIDLTELVQVGALPSYNATDVENLDIKMPVDINEQKAIGEFFANLDYLITLHQRKYDQLVKFKAAMLDKMFPKNGSKVPEIRFEGFTEDWEQRKLSSLCDKFTDGDWIESKDQSNSGVRLIQTGNVGVAEYLDKPNNKKWVSKYTFEALHCEEVFEGDILISRLPEPAGRACIVPDLGTKMITAVDCTIVRVSENISNEFMLQYLSSQKYFDEVNTCLAGGTRQRISRSNLADFDIPVPTKKQEQQEIGHFFRNLDHLITLQQRKLEKLNNIKKSMLEKMFV